MEAATVSQFNRSREWIESSVSQSIFLRSMPGVLC